MLISRHMDSVIRVLLCSEEPLTVSSLAGRAGLTRAWARRVVNGLKDSEYVKVGRYVTVIDRIRLARAWGYCYSVREIPKMEFLAPERPQYVMLKIANMARKEGLKYAFTLFSATEHVSPFVAPADTHLYVLEKDEKKWADRLSAAGMMRAEGGGNVICLLVGEEHFEGMQETRGVKVVCLPQLYADLFSYGGRGEEAAEEIAGLMRGKRNV